MGDMFKGHSMPRNKHKHLLIKVFQFKTCTRSGKKKATLNCNCPKHFLPCTDIPAFDKHLVLYCAQPVSTQVTHIYRQHYKNIKFIQFYSYKYNFISVFINFSAIKSNKIQPDKQDSMGSYYENIKGTKMGSAKKTGWRDVLQEIRGKGKKRGFMVFLSNSAFHSLT